LRKQQRTAQQTILEVGIEMAFNPMLQNKDGAGVMKRFDSFKGKGAGRLRAPSKQNEKPDAAAAGDV
jgi:hypothetical protein